MNLANIYHDFMYSATVVSQEISRKSQINDLKLHDVPGCPRALDAARAATSWVINGEKIRDAKTLFASVKIQILASDTF